MLDSEVIAKFFEAFIIELLPVIRNHGIGNVEPINNIPSYEVHYFFLDYLC